MAEPNVVVIGPQPGPQEAALACGADMVFLGGQAGGGKTYALLLEPLRHADKAGFGAVIFRRTAPQITQQGGLWEKSYDLYPHLGAIPRDGLHDWTFPSGAAIKFSHLQHEKDRLSWKGSAITLLGFDQAEEFTRRQFWYLFSRNRSTCGVRPYLRATCNPVPPDDETGGWLHELLGWWIGEDGYPVEERAGVLRWFLRVDDKLSWFASAADAIAYRDAHGMAATVGPTSVTFIPARLEDNLALMQADPSYAAKLEALPRVERLRLRGGNWLVRETAGTVLDRAWFEIVDALPVGCAAARYWDKAATPGGRGAETAGAKLLRDRRGLWYLDDVVHGRWGDLERENVIRMTAMTDGHDVRVYVEQEPGSGGKDSARATIRGLAGYTVRARRVTGAKVERARPFAAQAEAGNVKLLRAPWNADFLAQAHNFPEGVIDMVDATVGAFNELAAQDIGLGEFRIAAADLEQGPSWQIR